MDTEIILKKDELVTTQETFIVAMLREIRIEEQIVKSQISDFLGKDGLYWVNIENSTATLSATDFIHVTNFLKMNSCNLAYFPSVLSSYMTVFLNNFPKGKFSIVKKLEIQDDDVQLLLNDYYASAEFSKIKHN